MKNIITSLFFLLLASASMGQAVYNPPRPLQKQWQETYGVSLFRGVEGVWFDLEQDNSSQGAIAYFNILDWLRGRVAGLQVYNYRDIRVPLLRNQPATIFVDEMRVDYSFLNALSTADIGLVKVMPMASMAGAHAPGGAIAIYTKRGEAEEEEAS